MVDSKGKSTASSFAKIELAADMLDNMLPMSFHVIIPPYCECKTNPATLDKCEYPLLILHFFKTLNWCRISSNGYDN